MGLRHDHHCTLMRVVRRQSARNMENACLGKKMKACDQRREAITQMTQAEISESEGEKGAYHRPHLKAGAEEAWANETVTAWLTL